MNVSNRNYPFPKRGTLRLFRACPGENTQDSECGFRCRIYERPCNFRLPTRSLSARTPCLSARSPTHNCMPLSARLFFSDSLERANSCAFYYAPARYHRCTRCKLRGRLRLRANGTGAPLRRVPMYSRAAVALLTPRACCLPFPAFALCGLAVERRESSHKSASLRLSMRVITRSKSAEE